MKKNICYYVTHEYTLAHLPICRYTEIGKFETKRAAKKHIRKIRKDKNLRIYAIELKTIETYKI